MANTRIVKMEGDDGKGYIMRLTPKGWTPREIPAFAKLEVPALVELLTSPSATTRFYSQQERLTRPEEAKAVKPALVDLVKKKSLPLELRVAALLTLAQIESDPLALLAFASDEGLREFALRVATDRLPRLKDAMLPLKPFEQALSSGTPRQSAAAAIALGRLGNPEAAPALLSVAFTKPAPEGRATMTERFTVKKTRRPEVVLEVAPGDELRLHVVGTDDASKSMAVVVRGGVFALADGTEISLATLEPISGNLTVREEAAPSKPKKKKKAVKAGASLIVTGPAPVIYTVPPNAISFTARAESLNGKLTLVSAEFVVSTGRTGEPIQASAEPRNSTPNAGILIPHLAAHALVRLRAGDTCLAAIGTASEDLALWALSGLHEESLVDGLLAKLKQTVETKRRAKLLTTLARLYQQEAPYDGSWWWSTRPDTRGPYYKPNTWSASPKIATALEAELTGANTAQLDFLARLNDSHQLGLKKLGTRQSEDIEENLPTVDLAKTASIKGAIATTPIEDIILAMDKLEPNDKLGAELFTQQGCIACHALKAGGPASGPYMGQIGSIMSPDQIATADVKKEDHLATSTMPEGLANALSLENFAALVHFLASQK